jgi:hypothetical protein
MLFNFHTVRVSFNKGGVGMYMAWYDAFACLWTP